MESGKNTYDKNGDLIKMAYRDDDLSILKSNRLFGREKKFYEQIFSNLPLHWNELQIYNHIESKFNISQTQIPKIIKNFHWKYASDYSSLLEALKINKNTTVI